MDTMVQIDPKRLKTGSLKYAHKRAILYAVSKIFTWIDLLGKVIQVR